MTEITTKNNLLDTIKQNGYWRVLIKPTVFKSNLFTNNELAISIVESKVSLRGWDFPHGEIIAHNGKIHLNNGNSTEIKWTNSGELTMECNWPDGSVFEFWRAYTSGQFVHYIAAREDSWVSKDNVHAANISAGTSDIKKFLSVVSSVYYFTEIYNFASNFYKNVSEVEDVEITIEFHDASERALFFWDDIDREMWGNVCHYEKGIVRVSNIFKKHDLQTNKNELALFGVKEFFGHFGWTNIADGILEGDQSKLLQRRF